MKKELILNHLINVYLKDLTPISSKELKRRCELPFSPSTIRNYFQKLDNEGLLVKVHISSGSVPSKEAIQNFWIANLKYEGLQIAKNSLQLNTELYDLFVAIRHKESVVLKEILNIENRFIILDFQKYEVIFKYSKELFSFFKEFIEYSLDDIRKMLNHLKLKKLSEKFEIGHCEFFNKKFLYKNYKKFSIDSLLQDDIFEQFKKGISFNKDFLAYNVDVTIDKKKSELVVIGNIANDYLQFFESIKKEEV